MNRGLEYLKKLELNELLDNIFYTSLLLFKRHDGEICKVCKIKQGSNHKGWEKYYCKHTEKEVNKLLKKYQDKAINLLFNSQSNIKEKKCQ